MTESLSAHSTGINNTIYHNRFVMVEGCNSQPTAIFHSTPQPLYNPNQFPCKLSNPCYKESQMYSFIAKSVFNDHLGSSNDPCYVQNLVIMNPVIKRLRCNCLLDSTGIYMYYGITRQQLAESWKSLSYLACQNQYN